MPAFFLLCIYDSFFFAYFLERTIEFSALILICWLSLAFLEIDC